jgi:hypothetical protein
MDETVRRGLNPRSARVGFVVDKMALGQGFLRVFRISPVSIIQLMFYIQ